MARILILYFKKKDMEYDNTRKDSERQKKVEEHRQIIRDLDKGFDRIPLEEREGGYISDGQVFSLWNFCERSTENLEGTELVKEELTALNKYYDGKFFDIQIIQEEYKKDLDKDFEPLESGQEANVYFLSETGKNYCHVIKTTQWNAFSFRGKVNKTPLEFLINKTILHNRIFPGTSYKLLGACYRKDKDGENQFNFVFIQQYVEQLLDDNGEPIKATFEEIKEDMEKRGFREINPTTYVSDALRVSDLHIGNVLKGSDGRLYYIDPIIRLLNREYYKILQNIFK